MNNAMNMDVQVSVCFLSFYAQMHCCLGWGWGAVQLEALIHRCILTPGINLHLSLMSLVVEHDDFGRGGWGLAFR